MFGLGQAIPVKIRLERALSNVLWLQMSLFTAGGVGLDEL